MERNARIMDKKKKKPKKITPKNNNGQIKRKEGGQPNNKNAEKRGEGEALKLGQGLIDWMKASSTNIWYNEYLYEIADEHPDTVGYLSDKFPSFCDLIKKAKKMQETKIVKWAAVNKLNPAISIFCLKNNHGYTDRVDHTTNHQNINANNDEGIKSVKDKLDALSDKLSEKKN